MLKFRGFILTFSLLVVLVSSETVDNRTTPVNGRLSTSTTRKPLAQELSSTPLKVNGFTPGKSSTTLSRPVTPTRVSSPQRLDQTPSRAGSTTLSRPQTPVNRPPTPNQQLGSSSTRPPTPTGTSTLRPTPTATSGSTLTTRSTPNNQEVSSSNSGTRTTPKPTGSSSTTSGIITTTSGITSTTSFFSPSISFSSTTSFPITSSSPLTSSTTPITSSATPSITSSTAISSSTSMSSSSVSSSGSTSSSVESSSTSQSSSTSSSSPSSSSQSSSTVSSTVSTTTASSSPSSTASSSASSSPSSSSGSTSSTSASTTASSTTTTVSTTTASSTQSTTTTTAPPVNSGGELIHTQIQFCNFYDDVMQPYRTPIDVDNYMKDLRMKILNMYGLTDDRIRNFDMKKDYDGKVLVQFDVIPGAGKTPNEVVVDLQNKVNNKQLTINALFGDALNCMCDQRQMCPWTDYGFCKDEKCQNGGKCNVAATCQYFCECKADWVGKYCEQKSAGPVAQKKKENLWLLFLLIVPLALLALLLLLCCFCCLARGCCAGAAPRQKVEIIEEDIYQDVGGCSEHGTVRSCRSACSRPSVYAVNPSPLCVNDAGSTYYSALGRPFAVAFSDNTFSAVGYASHDAGIYNHCGKKILPAASCCGDGEIEVIMNKPRRGSCCGSVYSETGSGYHSALGNRYAVAYNDRSFNTYSSMPRTCSVRHYN